MLYVAYPGVPAPHIGRQCFPYPHETSKSVFTFDYYLTETMKTKTTNSHFR